VLLLILDVKLAGVPLPLFSNEVKSDSGVAVIWDSLLLTVLKVFYLFIRWWLLPYENGGLCLGFSGFLASVVIELLGSTFSCPFPFIGWIVLLKGV
jgi:hypothetical protein